MIVTDVIEPNYLSPHYDPDATPPFVAQVPVLYVDPAGHLQTALVPFGALRSYVPDAQTIAANCPSAPSSDAEWKTVQISETENMCGWVTKRYPP
jgi:hypothetical protein